MTQLQIPMGPVQGVVSDAAGERAKTEGIAAAVHKSLCRTWRGRGEGADA